MHPRIWIWTLAIPLVLTPQLARAQCCTMSMPGGSHSHESGVNSGERKAKRTIGRLLSRQEDRTLLLEALLQDRDFMESLIGRIAEDPEWRAMAEDRLGLASTRMDSEPKGQPLTRKSEPRQEEARRYRIEADEEGFHPTSLTIPAGTPVTLVVTRTSENTCAREIVIPSRNETHRLPLNRPVEIKLPPQKKGTLTFACGMDMYRGRLLIQ